MSVQKLIFPILILCIISCQNRSESGYNMMKESQSASADYGESPEAYETADQEEFSQDKKADSSIPNERKIIRTAEIRAEVDDLEASTAKVEEKVKKYKGFIGNVDFSNNYSGKEVNFTIRIPSDQFEALLNDLGKEALYIDYKRVSANDVTEEYLDIETRLETKKDVRDRYIDILRNKAKTVQDVLMAEDKIRIIQEEIEAKEGRLKYLKSQVSLSTIRLNLYEEVSGSEIKQPGFFKNISRAFGNGWEVLLDIIIGLVYSWPVILIGILAFFGIRKIWRSSRK